MTVQFQANPPYDGLVAKVKGTFGPHWIEKQRLVPLEARHVVVRWLDEWNALPERLFAESEVEVAESHLSGQAQELVALGCDLTTLGASGPLPSKLRNRLRDHREYQGARYELAVAAMIQRCGLPIRWHPDKSIPEWRIYAARGGPEFFASIPGTQVRVAVEAKSRHRPGALNVEGTLDTEAYLADVGHLLHAAEQKDTQGCPLIVFIDLNLPDRPDVEGKPAWLHQIEVLMSAYDGPERSAGFCLAVFTNFAWHFAGQTSVLTRPPASLHVPKRSLRELKYPTLVDRIHRALEGYGVPSSEGALLQG
ncbi:MAG: hypothetical protein HY901_18215 [Deltaproteobacteria bacterium]|nr:hypothetical protein [Deltaproteobacteria bacterium]